MKLSAKFFESNLKIILVLILVPTLLYFKSLFYSFSPLDEQWLILKKTDFLSNWENIINSFKDPVAKLYYRPLLMISFIIDYHLSQLNPFAYHLTNLVLHLFCVVFIYKLLLLLKIEKKLAFGLTLLFSVHPALLHAVAWVPGRNDSLLCFFVVLSFIFLIHYSEKNKLSYLFFHLLFFAMALFTKENAIVLPLLFSLLFLINNKSGKKLALLVFTWIAIICAWYYLKSAIAPYHLPLGTNFFTSVKNFIFGLLIFIGKTLIPVNQSVSPTIKNSSFYFGILVLMLFFFLAFKIGFKYKKVAFFGLAVFFILLIIPAWYGTTSPLGEQYEHRAYTSIVGLLIFASQLNFDFNSRKIKYVFAILFLFFSCKTFLRMNVYKTQLSYLDEGIKDCPEFYMFYFQKSWLLAQNHEYAAALPYVNKAIEIQPQKKHLFENRANIYAHLGKKNECIADYNTAISLDGGFDIVLYLGRCAAYNQFGDMTNAMKDLNTLKQCCSKDIPPQLESAILKNYDIALFDNLNYQIKKNPANALNYVTRAKYYMGKRKGMEALNDLKKACELEPGNKEFKSYYNQLNSTFPH